MSEQGLSEQVKPASIVDSSAVQPGAAVVSLVIYIAQHCPNCAYAYEVADEVRRNFPQVHLRMVDLDATVEEIPEVVFATPTYLLNGRVWSLGNPSRQQVMATFHQLLKSYEQVGA